MYPLQKGGRAHACREDLQGPDRLTQGDSEGLPRLRNRSLELETVTDRRSKALRWRKIVLVSFCLGQTWTEGQNEDRAHHQDRQIWEFLPIGDLFC